MTDPLALTLGPPPDPGCAACDHLRRECPPDCILRPYFPLSDRQSFDNVNRHFGVPGLTRILEKVAPEHMDDAVKSIVYESNAHATFPVCKSFSAGSRSLRPNSVTFACGSISSDLGPAIAEIGTTSASC